MAVAVGTCGFGFGGRFGIGAADVSVSPGVIHIGRVQPGPATTADCEKFYKVGCYEPAQIQQAYHLPAA
jgi:hypothetical protein